MKSVGQTLHLRSLHKLRLQDFERRLQSLFGIGLFLASSHLTLPFRSGGNGNANQWEVWTYVDIYEVMK